MDTFKLKITLDRHNGIQNLNYYDLPDPPRFSLPSTFKERKTAKEMTFLRHLLFGLLDVSLQRYDSANFGLILKKRRICPVLRITHI